MGKENILYNKDTGFNVIVNLYIIRYLYSHMRNNLVRINQAKKEKESVIEKYDFYKLIDVSRDRFQRMCRGENFQVMQKNKDHFRDLFGIDESYFEKNGKIIEIHQLTEKDWRCFLNEKYLLKYDVTLTAYGKNSTIERKAQENAVKKVITVLGECVKKNLIENTYDTDSPLYRVFYYYKNNVTFKEESQFTKFARELVKLKISDWNDVKENEEQLKKYGELLKKHSNYVEAMLTCLKYQKE